METPEMARLARPGDTRYFLSMKGKNSRSPREWQSRTLSACRPPINLRRDSTNPNAQETVRCPRARAARKESGNVWPYQRQTKRVGRCSTEHCGRGFCLEWCCIRPGRTRGKKGRKRGKGSKGESGFLAALGETFPGRRSEESQEDSTRSEGLGQDRGARRARRDKVLRQD